MLFAIYDQDATPEHGGKCESLDLENLICTVEADSAEVALRGFWREELTNSDFAQDWQVKYVGCRVYSKLHTKYAKSPGGWQCAIEVPPHLALGALEELEHFAQMMVDSKTCLDPPRGIFPALDRARKFIEPMKAPA